MKRRKVFRASVAALAALYLTVGAAQAQGTGWQPFISVTPAYQGDAELDQGGEFDVKRALVRLGAVTALGGGNSAGLNFSYDYSDYSFSNPVRFNNVAPWSIVQRYGVAVPLSFALGDGWSLGVAPSVDWFRENGADTGDSLAWGSLLSATRRFDNGNRLGFGVGVFDRVEDTSVFPYLVIDWRLGDRWRLINPLAAGPTGPAGLELDYEFDSDWAVGIGAAWRTERFRLSDRGPVPNGVGEEREAPVFLRATRTFGSQSALHFFAGVLAAGELRVEDPSGNVLRKDDFDATTFFAITFVGRF